MTPIFRLIIVSFCLLIVARAEDISRSSLRRVGASSSSAECPLKRTAVRAEISGMLSRVTVVQQFLNPFPDTIEAVYVFPLPNDASVDRMTMIVGGRRIKGVMKTREEALALYEKAKNAGQAASRLDQERPNIFTQSVANIGPGAEIKVEISYFQILKYEQGDYEFSFPMVVGPRYSPKTMSPADAARIAPPITESNAGLGHDITLEVDIDAGGPIGNIASKTHEIDIHRTGANRVRVELRSGAESPDRDFILRYDTAGRGIETSVFAHRVDKDGFFTLIVQPPEHSVATDITPKELIFVLDTSGSMSGFPIQKAQETMSRALGKLSPRDTFNLITFSGDTDILFPLPVPGTPENLRIAQMFLASRSGAGGTEMMKAIRAALDPSGEAGRIRVVCFMTDGYVGNDMEILAEIRKHPEARVFAFGIGSAVNRFLLDGLAHEGRGDVEYVGLKDDGEAAVKRFEQRVREPILTGVSVDWGGLPVTDVYPKRIPDLFSAKPVIVTGRYSGPGRATVRVKGLSGGRAVEIPVSLDLPAAHAQHDSLMAYWARQQVAELTSQDYAGVQSGSIRPEVKNAIAKVGVEYGIMTQFTSFVAVEERVVDFRGIRRRVEVPVALPQGVRPGGINAGSPVGVVGGVGGGVGSGAATGGGMYVMSAPRAVPLRVPAVNSSIPAATASKLEQRLVDLMRSSRSGVIEVLVQLTDTSKAVTDSLSGAGLMMLQPPNRARQVRGRIDASRLLALAVIPEVRYVVLAGRTTSSTPQSK